MHHESEWGPRPERECGDEVHILGKKIEPVWPFLDGLTEASENENPSFGDGVDDITELFMVEE